MDYYSEVIPMPKWLDNCITLIALFLAFLGMMATLGTFGYLFWKIGH